MNLFLRCAGRLSSSRSPYVEALPRWPQRWNARSTFHPQPPRRCGDEPCPGQPPSPLLGPLCVPCFVSLTDRPGLFLFFALPALAPLLPRQLECTLNPALPGGPAPLQPDWKRPAHLDWGRYALGTPQPPRCPGTGMLGHLGECVCVGGVPNLKVLNCGGSGWKIKAHFGSANNLFPSSSSSNT